MEPRYGRLYASAVLRPLAEQVVDALGVQPGATVCDLICDGGTLGIAMGGAVGNRGKVTLVDVDAGLVQAAMRDVAATGCAVSTLVATQAAVPLPRASCDRVASLCTHGFWEGASLFDVAERATRRDGCAAIVTWNALRLPLHEVALDDALHEVCGIRARFLQRCLASLDSVPASGWQEVTLHDVVRFDGIGAYWAAMVGARPLALELAGEPEAALAAVRAACSRSLESCTAADGTLLIPVSATLYLSRSRPGA